MMARHESGCQFPCQCTATRARRRREAAVAVAVERLNVQRRPATDVGTGWRSRAACRGQDPAIFFPDVWDVPAAEQVRSFCEPCPVRTECREAGEGESGCWGGTTERQRRRERYVAS